MERTQEGVLRSILRRIVALENRRTILPTAALPPAGAVSQFAGAVAPDGWLLCDGSAVSRTTYARLFAVIGTTYGAGNGTTTFNLPNLKGRVPVGRDAAQAEFDVLGETGGAKTHALTVAQMPSHDHGGSTGSAGAHTHNVQTNDDGTFITGTSGDRSLPATGSGTFRYVIEGTSGSTRRIVTASAGAHSHSIGAQGNGDAHPNLQPYLVLNHIIKV